MRLIICKTYKMKVKISIFFKVVFVLFFSLGCNKDDNREPVKEYESCCGTEPSVLEIGKSYVYIPNVFTPNGDGKNDVFYPFVNDNINRIVYFEVFAETDTSKILLYQVTNVSLDEVKKKGWNGLDNDGKPHKGYFTYSIYFQSKDKPFKIKGAACAVLCGEDSSIFKNKEGCFYPEQVDDNGVFMKSIQNSETDCFN